jgi:hypothetical protein
MSTPFTPEWNNMFFHINPEKYSIYNNFFSAEKTCLINLFSVAQFGRNIVKAECEV